MWKDDLRYAIGQFMALPDRLAQGRAIRAGGALHDARADKIRQEIDWGHRAMGGGPNASLAAHLLGRSLYSFQPQYRGDFVTGEMTPPPLTGLEEAQAFGIESKERRARELHDRVLEENDPWALTLATGVTRYSPQGWGMGDRMTGAMDRAPAAPPSALDAARIGKLEAEADKIRRDLATGGAGGAAGVKPPTENNVMSQFRAMTTSAFGGFYDPQTGKLMGIKPEDSLKAVNLASMMQHQYMQEAYAAMAAGRPPPAMGEVFSRGMQAAGFPNPYAPAPAAPAPAEPAAPAPAEPAADDSGNVLLDWIKAWVDPPRTPAPAAAPPAAPGATPAPATPEGWPHSPHLPPWSFDPQGLRPFVLGGP